MTKEERINLALRRIADGLNLAASGAAQLDAIVLAEEVKRLYSERTRFRAALTLAGLPEDTSPADAIKRLASLLSDAEAERDELRVAANQDHAEIKRLRKELRETDEDRHVQGRREAAMMEALPHRRFAGGMRVDEMVIEVCAWLRELRPDLWSRA